MAFNPFNDFYIIMNKNAWKIKIFGFNVTSTDPT